MNPDSAEKMRNHLAEEVLDSNMLHLMKEYQKSLRKGQELDGAVDLLEQSSRLISIFRDSIPITSIHDKRIGTLLSIREWFRTWREEGGSSSESKMKPSVKCLDDIDSLISTFTEIVNEHLKRFPGVEVYPSRFNSDIIENNFCQVRGLHNGNTTNPAYASYQCTMNSVILGQSSISRGRKSNAGITSADPFNFHVQKQMKREPLKQITDNCQNKKNKIYTSIQKEHYCLVEAYCFNIHCILMLVCLPGISLRHLAFHRNTSSLLAINLTGLSPGGSGLFILCRSCWDSRESSPLFEKV